MQTNRRLLFASIALLTAAPMAGATIPFTNFDQNHSTIGFSVPILDGMSQVEGKFTSFSVKLDYDSGDVTRSKVEAHIQVASLDTGIPDRDNDLRSAVFFDAAKYPEITFSSGKVTRRGDDLLVSGTLTIKGVPHEVELVCRIRGPQADAKTAKLLLGVAASTTIDRRAFGIAWEHPVAGFVGDAIPISLHLISKLTAPPAAGASGPQG